MKIDYRQFPILVVDDEPDILRSFEINYGDDFTVVTAESGQRGLDLLRIHDAAIIVADQRMPLMSGAEFLKRSINLRPDALHLILTGFADHEALVRAVNAGRVYRYLSKPWDDEELRLTLYRAFEYFVVARDRDRLTEELRVANASLKQANERLSLENAYLREHNWRGQLIGSGPAMRKVLDLIAKVAPLPTTVLIEGETGTGKEEVARAIHAASPRREKTFVAVNCAEIKQELQESELFGHRKGSFSGAGADHKGLFEVANGSTLFLDEITEASTTLQAALLRVLQEREVRPVGETQPRKVDVRVIAATNRNLDEEVKAGRFRQDLYFRLNALRIHVPPLRERREDIPELAGHLIERLHAELKLPVAEITDDALVILMQYQFPGNVRELSNELQRAMIHADPGAPITEDLLSDHLQEIALESTPPTGLQHVTREFEREKIIAALAAANGVKARAAEDLGMTYRGLQKKMKRLGM